jgi:TPR repeat protein
MNKYTEVRKLLLRLYAEVELTQPEKVKIYNNYLRQIRKLAYNNDAHAQYDLAQHYEDIGFFGNPNPFFDNSKRFYWYQKAAVNKNAAAHNNLADLFERGDGCSKELNKALEYYKKSMELGDSLGKKTTRKCRKT